MGLADRITLEELFGKGFRILADTKPGFKVTERWKREKAKELYALVENTHILLEDMDAMEACLSLGVAKKSKDVDGSMIILWPGDDGY